MHLYRLFPLFLLYPVLGCASAPPPKDALPEGQSFPAAVAMICDVDKLAGLSADADPLGVGQKRSEWIGQHVDNPDGIELRTRLSVKGAAEQGQMLRDQAKKTGIPRCALADALEKDGSGGLSP